MAHFIKPHLSLTPDPNAHALTGFSIVTPPSHVTHSGVPELVLGRRPRDRGSPDPTEPNWAPLTLAPRPKRLSLVRESQLGASLCPCPSDEEGPTSGPRTVMSREVRTCVENNWWLSRPMNKLHFFFFFLEQRPKGIQQTAQGDTWANEGGGKGNGGQPWLREPPVPWLQPRGAAYPVHPDLPLLENPEIQVCMLNALILKSGFIQVCDKHS